MQTIQNVIKDTSPSQEHQNHPQLQQELSSIFEWVLDAFKLNLFQPNFNLAPSLHVQTIQNVIKNTSPSEERQNNHQLQQEL